MTQWFSSRMWSDFFTWRGRLNRWRYFFRTMLLAVPVELLDEFFQASKISFPLVAILFAPAIMLIGIVVAALLVLQLIKRCHDLDLPGWVRGVLAMAQSTCFRVDTISATIC